MKRLHGRAYDICAGRTQLSAEKVAAYRKKFAALGYAVPPLHGRPREAHWDGMGDAIAWLVRVLRIPHSQECARCWRRREALNELVPFPIAWPSSLPFIP